MKDIERWWWHLDPLINSHDWDMMSSMVVGSQGNTSVRTKPKKILSASEPWKRSTVDTATCKPSRLKASSIMCFYNLYGTMTRRSSSLEFRRSFAKSIRMALASAPSSNISVHAILCGFSEHLATHSHCHSLSVMTTDHYNDSSSLALVLALSLLPQPQTHNNSLHADRHPKALQNF